MQVYTCINAIVFFFSIKNKLSQILHSGHVNSILAMNIGQLALKIIDFHFVILCLFVF